MKQIETGCLAVVIGGKTEYNNGKVVTVGQYLGHVEGFTCNPCWEVDVDILTTKGFYVQFIAQAMLLRIDGHIDEEVVESELELIGSK